MDGNTSLEPAEEHERGALNGRHESVLVVLHGQLLVDSQCDQEFLRLDCWHSREWEYDTELIVGKEPHYREMVDREFPPNLGWDETDCPITAYVYRADQAWLDTQAKIARKPAVGSLSQRPRGEDRPPNIELTIGVDPKEFDVLRSKFRRGRGAHSSVLPGFNIEYAADFSDGARVTRSDGGWVDILWDDGQPVPVTEVEIVQRGGTEQNKPAPSRPTQNRDLEILHRLNAVEDAIARLGLPAWIAVTLLVVIVLWLLSR